jgi:hypothetical protein
MSSPVARTSRAIERVQPQRDKLREAHHALIAASDTTKEAAVLADAIVLLRAAFTVHVDFAEGPGGLFEELLDDSPTEAAQEVDRLKRDHEVIVSIMDRVEGLQAEGVSLNDERLSEAVSELVRLLTRHRRHGAEVLYNVYGVDIGSGD